MESVLALEPLQLILQKNSDCKWTVPPAPPEGRDGASRRTRLRPLAGDAPVGSAPLTGSADEDGGEGSAVRRRRRTILGAANVRRPMLTSRLGARFLGR